jgi:hypothetical protein
VARLPAHAGHTRNHSATAYHRGAHGLDVDTWGAGATMYLALMRRIGRLYFFWHRAACCYEPRHQLLVQLALSR